MAELPFLFNAAEFHPLQPEDAPRELALRSNPTYAPMYVNVAQQYYDAQAPQSAVVNDYQAWVEECRRMDAEVESAKSEWRMALIERDEEIARLKLKCEMLRHHAKTLEGRPKPQQPRSARKGNSNGT